MTAIRLRQLAQRMLRVTLLAVTLSGAGVVAAHAQDVDWITNFTVDPDPSSAGGTIAFTITVLNDGDDLAPANTLTLTIPANFTFSGATGAITGCGPTPLVGPGTVTCNVPPIASTATAVLNASIVSSIQGTGDFTASVGTAGDTDPTNNTENKTLTITAGANVGVIATAPATAQSGSRIPFTFTAVNAGPDDATGAVIEIAIPTGLVNIVAPAGCAPGGIGYRCTVPGTLANGASVDFDFTGQISVASGSSITGVGSISEGAPPDPVADNNTATFTSNVTVGSDVALNKARIPLGTALVGDAAQFVLTASYTGDVPNTLTITDTIPNNYSIGAITTTEGWSCTVSGQTVTCTKPGGTVAGAGVSLGAVTINTTIVSSAADVVNTAVISAATPNDPDPVNNTATDSPLTIVEPFIDLTVSKVGPSPAIVAVGGDYDYDLTTTNLGNVPFYGTLVMSDVLPAGMTSRSYALNGWSCAPLPPVVGPATITCQRTYTEADPLPAGASTPALTVSTLITATGTLRNEATITSPDSNLPDNNPGNGGTGVDVISTGDTTSADISVVKTRSAASVVAGEIETFTIEVANSGPQPALAVEVRDDLLQLMNSAEGPTASGLVSVALQPNAATGATCTTNVTSSNSRRLSCDFATLPICTTGLDCPVITVSIRAGGNAGTRTNRVTALSQTTPDGQRANNSSSVDYAVTQRTDVTVEKSASGTTVPAGQPFTYVITASVVANGLSDAQSVVITDTLPAGLRFISATPSVGSCTIVPSTTQVTAAGNDQLVCGFGAILNGAQRTVTVIVEPTESLRSTSIINNVAISTTSPETDATNNSAAVTTAIGNPALDLLVQKTESIDPVAVGDDTVYSITVRNVGPSTAENVVASDFLPSGNLSFQSVAIPANGSCTTVPAVNSIGGSLICSFPVIRAGEARVIQVTMRGVAKGVATNRAQVASDETIAGFDTQTRNNSVAESTTVRTNADMQVVSKAATPGTVNLRDTFSYALVVRNNTGVVAGRVLAEADEVFVSDTLPAGMILTGAPTIQLNSGTTTLSTCTGTSGSISFRCSLGSVSSGGQVTITVPVKIIAVTANPQTFRNTASVVTSSRDRIPANDSNFGDVVTGSSSVSGTLFRDFNNNGLLTAAADTGIGSIPIRLTGTAFDGTPIDITVNTAANGTYQFVGLAEGTYVVTQGTISEAYLNNGTNTVGSTGGALVGATQITNITLAPNEAATGYNFAKIPVARIGVAKTVQAGPSINPDGSFNVTFRLNATNLSLEALNTVAISDVLQGASPLFGTQVTLATPATTAMTAGTYTMLAGPSGTCGGNSASFDGAATIIAAQGITLAAGASCTVDLQLRVKPLAPLPPVLASGGRYDNQATITGVGALSGQRSDVPTTSPLYNAQLADLSDNGTSVDSDGNGQANEAGNNDPTPVIVNYTPAITLVKTASTTDFGTPVAVGNKITYTFSITNSGNVTLTNVTLSDVLAGIIITGGPIASLAPGETDSTTFKATYSLTNADIAAKQVTNSATATGAYADAGGGNPPLTVSDVSGSDANNDTPTVVSLGGIALVKTSDLSALQSPVRVGDIVTYNFAVTNTGPTALTEVTITDALPDITITGNPIATLVPGATDSTTISATYAVKQADLDAGRITNSAVVTGNYGTDSNGNPVSVTDTSGSSNTNDNPNVTPLAQTPQVRLLKNFASIADTNSNTVTDAGDTVTFVFTVSNVGNVALTNVTVTDPLISGIATPGLVLAIGSIDSNYFSGTYVLKQEDVDRGYLQNSATASGDAVTTDGTPINGQNGAQLTTTDVSDSGTAPDRSAVADPETTETVDGTGATDGDPTNDPTVILLQPTPSIVLTKFITSIADTNASGVRDDGDTVNYGFAVTNTGNVTLGNVTITDPLIAVAGGPVTISPGATNATGFTASYVLTLSDIDRGYIQNSATVSGRAQTASGTPILNDGEAITVSDVSDTGTAADLTIVTSPATTETPDGTDASDNDPTNDPTVATLAPVARIDLIKRVISVIDTNADGLVNVGDTVNYNFTVTNRGNVTLSGITVTDPIVAVAGGPITLAPRGVNSTAFTANYVLVQADIDREYLQNTATTSGNAVTSTGTPVLVGGTQLTATDVSDTGTTANRGPIANPGTTESPDGAGNTDSDPTNDPTVINLASEPSIELVKSITSVTDVDANGFTNAGDTVQYRFAVTNTGNLNLAGISVSDPLVTVSGGPIILAIGATNSTAFTATYTLVQADIDRGFVQNSATTTGNAVNLNGAPILVNGQPLTVTDVSDTGTDPDRNPVTNPAGTENPDGTGATDGDPTNDPTVALIPRIARLQLTKSIASVTDTNESGRTDAGDTVGYVFVVRNTGNLDLQGVSVTDPLVTVTGGPVDLAINATDSDTFKASYVLTIADLDRGYVQNTATATGDAVDADGDPILVDGDPLTAEDVSDSGTNPDRSPVTTPETTETPDGTGATDNNPTNDPTVLALTAARITLLKSISSISDTNTSGVTDAGDTVNYVFAVTNAGNTNLAGVTVSDALVTVSGGPVDIAAGDTDSGTFSASYVLTQTDVDRGFVQNTATTSGNAVSSTGAPLLDRAGTPIVVSDVSDTGTAPDLSTVTSPATTETPNGTGGTDTDPTNDPTVAQLSPLARLSLIKSITAVTDVNGNGFTDAGDTVTYRFAVTNTGNVALSGITVTDPVVTVSGGPINLAVRASDTTTFSAVYTLTQTDVDTGYRQNTATATGNAVTAGGAPILVVGAPLTATDVSDAGTYPALVTVTDPESTETPDGSGAVDGNPANDPTVIILGPVARIDLLKSVASVADTNNNGVRDAGDTVTYRFIVTNTGAVRLAGITVSDPRVTEAGGPIALAPGASDSTTFSATYVLVQADLDRGYFQNSATVTGNAVTTGGTPILAGGAPVRATDVSDTGTAPNLSTVTNPATTETPDGMGATDSNPTNDPTVVTLSPVASLSLIKSVLSVTDVNDNTLTDEGDIVIYGFTVRNTGNLALINVSVSDPMLGTGAIGTISSLAVGASNSSVTGTYAVITADIDRGFIQNTATASGDAVDSSGNAIRNGNGNQIVATDVSDTGTNPDSSTVANPEGVETPDGSGVTDTNPADDPTVIIVSRGIPGGLSLTKTAGVSTVQTGDLVPYTITVTNRADGVPAVVDILDILPAGFVFQEGSATIDGVAAIPTVAGGVVTFADVAMARGQTRVITLRALVTGSTVPGPQRNIARALDSATGALAAADAVAIVRLVAEPVFDCSTVIGRVFDDINQDGYMNGRPEKAGNNPEITNQDYDPTGKYGDKYAVAPEDITTEQAEKGLPGVRLVAPNGMSVTTDAHGRFNVPCAALPRDIGSNFMLKLDERTLPSGYRLTTENPRVVRVTAGMLTKLNFGAALSRVVRIDLSAQAFDGDGAKPSANLEAGLRKMITTIQDTPSMLRISYLVRGETNALVKARIREVERIIKKLWPANGRYQLNIEHTIRRPVGAEGKE